MKGPILHPEGCIDASQTTTTSAPNSPIAKAEARVEGEKVKGWVHSIVLALSIGVNVVLFLMYLDSQRAVTEAYKDIKTQVWVKQDKDEEKFQKFIAGPYAQQMAEVRLDEMLRQQQILACKEKVK